MRGDHQEKSDIDLAVTGGDIEGFRTDAEEKINTLLLFDVVSPDGNPGKELLDVIGREGLVIYDKI